VRRLPGTPDPLALFGALTGNGTRADTVLLESADAASGQGEQSLVLPRMMLRLEGRGNTVRMISLTPNGEALRNWLEGALGCGASVTREGEVLVAEWREVSGRLEARERLRVAGPLDALRAVVNRLRLVSEPAAIAHLAAGIFSYDLVDTLERLPPAKTDPLDFPDFVFWVPEQIVVLDHVHRATTILAHVVGGTSTEESYHDAVRAIEAMSHAVATAGAGPSPLSSRASARDPSLALGMTPAGPAPTADLDDTSYATLVTRLQGHIVAGDVFQIVPSRTFSLPCPDPFAAYARLRAANPSPYMFYVRASNFTLLGASPETAVKVAGRPRTVVLRPIAGTAPRGRGANGCEDHELDARLQAALMTDAKELAEHMMLVDLARNDVARVSRPGTRRVSRLLAVDRYQHVMHLVSEVTGELDAGLDALHAYAATLNMGTLVGAPKIRAAELLRGHECSKRGPYGGAVGYLTHAGDMDTAIVIRSALVRNGVAHIRAGAGVVLDSDPAREADETRRKAMSVVQAVAGATA
jgi:anthranilate synthase component 1